MGKVEPMYTKKYVRHDCLTKGNWSHKWEINFLSRTKEVDCFSLMFKLLTEFCQHYWMVGWDNEGLLKRQVGMAGKLLVELGRWWQSNIQNFFLFGKAVFKR